MASKTLLVLAFVGVLAAQCAALNVSTTCAGDLTGTDNGRYSSVAACASDCDRDFCLCLGGVSSGLSTCDYSGTDFVINKVLTANALATGCSKMQKCLRSRVWCLNAFANDYGASVTPIPLTPVPTPVPTPLPPVTPVPPPTPVPATPVPTPVPPPTPVPSTIQPTTAPVANACRATAYPLKVSLATIAGGTAYAGTVADKSCQWLMCNDHWSWVSMFSKRCPEANFGPTNVCKADAVRPADAVVDAQIHLSGVGIDAWYALDRRAVYRALITDLAAYIDADPSFVQITDLRLGTLIVDFNLFGGTEASRKAQVAALTGADMRAFSKVVGVTPTLAVTRNDDADSGRRCGDGCIAGIVIGSFFFVVIIVVIGVVVSKRGGSAEKASEPAN